MDSEATLTVVVKSTEEVQPGPPRGPATLTPPAPPISKLPVQPPIQPAAAPQPPSAPKPPTPEELATPFSYAGGGPKQPISSFPAQVQSALVEMLRAQKAAGAPPTAAPPPVAQPAPPTAAPPVPTAPSAPVVATPATYSQEILEAARKARERDQRAIDIELARRALDPEGIGGVGTRGDVLLRDRQRRKREQEGEPPEPPKDETWAMSEAQRMMQRDAEKEMLERARRQVDPAYGRQKAQEEEARKRKEEEQRQRDSRQWAASGAIGLQAAGMPGLAGIAGGFAAGGIAGAAVAAVKMAIDKITEAVQASFKIGSAMISFDPDRFARGMADLVGKVPLVGGLMGSLAHGILDLGDAVMHTAEKLSAYNGELATQLAQIELYRIQLDIRRAQQFGPQIMQAVNARFEFEKKLNDFMDKHMPKLLQLATSLLEILGGVIDLPENIFKAFAGTIAEIIDAVSGILGPVNPFAEIIKHLRRIASNTEPENDGGAADNLDQLFNMAQGLQELVPQAPAVGGFFGPNLNVHGFAG